MHYLFRDVRGKLSSTILSLGFNYNDYLATGDFIDNVRIFSIIWLDITKLPLYLYLFCALELLIEYFC